MAWVRGSIVNTLCLSVNTFPLFFRLFDVLFLFFDQCFEFYYMINGECYMCKSDDTLGKNVT